MPALRRRVIPERTIAFTFFSGVKWTNMAIVGFRIGQKIPPGHAPYGSYTMATVNSTSAWIAKLEMSPKSMEPPSISSFRDSRVGFPTPVPKSDAVIERYRMWVRRVDASILEDPAMRTSAEG